MEVEVDVFISNYTIIDPEIYKLWVDGHSGKVLYDNPFSCR